MLILSGMLKDNKTQNLTDKQVEYASTIYGAGKDLLNLINDILDLSKVEAGQIEFNYCGINATEICGAMRLLFETTAEQKRLTFRAEVVGERSLILQIDQQRTQQVLKNLISNALKFTDAGEIALRINLAEAEHNPLASPAVAFSVSDTGIGVAVEKQGIIFEAFKQADGMAYLAANMAAPDWACQFHVNSRARWAASFKCPVSRDKAAHSRYTCR